MSKLFAFPLSSLAWKRESSAKLSRVRGSASGAKSAHVRIPTSIQEFEHVSLQKMVSVSASEKTPARTASELRQRSTTSEAILWNALRDRKLAGRKFRRQVPIGLYMVDFYCAAEQLALEVDGSIHAYQQEDDILRQQNPETLNIRFLRFNSEAIEYHLEEVLIAIRAHFRTNHHEFSEVD
ncbi:MAG: DUF559 domain-containing protein [bacterium]|nr:DUF559 domain-containing protein [bacterium]